MKQLIYKAFSILLLIIPCNTILAQNIANNRDFSFSSKMVKFRSPISKLEQSLINAGLVNIEKLDSNLIINLKYTTTDNFVGVDLYEDLDKCYLQQDVAQKLLNAQKFLKEANPELTLMVYDGARPRSAQQKMWDVVKMPIEDKVKFVSNPKRGSIHNYGCAVDVTLATVEGEELDMGTPFDHMGIEAHPVAEQRLLAEGVLTEEVVKNRQLLRGVMYKAGFYNIQSEWWHFNSCTREVAQEKYKIIE